MRAVTEKTRALMSKARLNYLKNHVVWNKGLTKEIDERIKKQAQKISLSLIGNKRCLGYKQTREHIRKYLKKRTPSSLELKMLELIEKLNLPYKFVGNGSFFIERKNPDFINVNGEKIAVEVYKTSHKEMFKNNGLNGWKKERQLIFNKYNWRIEFFNETQLTEKEVLRRL